MLDESYDPLFVVNSKQICPECKNDRGKRRICNFCRGSGRLPINLCGMWYPSAGFLICGGPSVNKLDTSKLRERGIVSFGVNNVSAHIQVDAWTFSDPQTKFHHGLFFDPKCMTFAPIPKLKKRIRAKLPDGTFRIVDKLVRDCPNTFGYERKTVFEPKEFLSTWYAHWGMGGSQQNRPFTCLCTMLLGLRLMHYLGCKRVYLLGVDLWMTEEQPYAFNQEKNVRNDRYIKENEMLRKLRPIFDQRDFKVFNCNPESKCDAFPYVPYEEALDDCRGAVPKTPFDLSQWYNKGTAIEFLEKYPNPITEEELIRIQKKTSAS